MNGEYIKANIEEIQYFVLKHFLLAGTFIPLMNSSFQQKTGMGGGKLTLISGFKIHREWILSNKSKLYTLGRRISTSRRYNGVPDILPLGLNLSGENANKVAGIRVMNSSELGRPRIDVITQISGLYRDTFPMKVKLIDQAVRLAYEQDEQDNYVRENTNALQLSLNDSILMEIFLLTLRCSECSVQLTGPMVQGWLMQYLQATHGIIVQSLVELYISRMSYVYGENIWGQTVTDYIEQQTGHGTNIDSSLLFASNLEGTRSIFHSRSSNTYGSIDIDDFYQYMGGLYNAITYISATSPELLW